MSTKPKIVFEQVLNDFRNDLDNLTKLDNILRNKLRSGIPDSDTKNWIMDVYIDKVLEIQSKMIKIKREMVGRASSDFTMATNALVQSLQDIAFANYNDLRTFHEPRVKGYHNGVFKAAEAEFNDIRKRLWHSDWKGLEKIKPVEYITSERKKYVTAREELQKAKECIENNPTDVMIHLRSAIDLSIKERFGFTKIHPMMAFFKDADKLGFPLPSYDLIYDYFNEGSERIHNGKISTPFEAKEAVRTISNFIDALETIEVDQSKIDDFKSKCKAVE